MTRTASKSTKATMVANPNKPCGCGACAEFTRGTYAPGHDARHAGLVAREVARTRNTDLLDQLPSAALRIKAGRMVDALLTTKPAKSAKAATVHQDGMDVKVGRWTYPARIVDGNLVRNTKRDGSGEWIAA
jgi:hypothetical protein